MAQASVPAPAQNASSSAVAIEARKVMGADELNWSCFQAAVSCMLPKSVAAELLAHGRTHYFSPHSKMWREALRMRDRSHRHVYGGKMLGLV